MPYAISERDEGWVVYNPDTMRVYGRHPSREAALAQQRALYANAPPEDEKRASLSGLLVGGWIGVDLDGTLAVQVPGHGDEEIGDPIPLMVSRVKRWLADDVEVRILTARVAPTNGHDVDAAREAIGIWCREHLGQALPVTCMKDPEMIEAWDDRAVQVVPNTGVRADGGR